MNEIVDHQLESSSVLFWVLIANSAATNFSGILILLFARTSFNKIDMKSKIIVYSKHSWLIISYQVY